MIYAILHVKQHVGVRVSCVLSRAPPNTITRDRHSPKTNWPITSTCAELRYTVSETGVRSHWPRRSSSLISTNMCTCFTPFSLSSFLYNRIIVYSFLFHGFMICLSKLSVNSMMFSHQINLISIYYSPRE